VTVLELRHLHYFIAVAEELHFSKAAERLQMAQPPLSQQIKKLEDDLGVTLLNRTQRKVELTAAGYIFLERCYEILNFVNEANEEARRVQNGEVGQLILGFTGSVTFDLLPKILRLYRTLYPKVNIVLKQLTSTEQMTALNEGAIHVGLLVSPVESTTLELEDLRKETFLAVLPHHHWLAHNDESINPYQLRNESFVMTPRKAGPAYYDSTINFLQNHGITPRISFEAQELYTIVALVSSGLGIALLPESIKFFHNPEVVYKELIPSFTTTTSIAYSKKRTLPLVESFIKLVKDNFQV
jgi:DNA-binding transcriptional LysR family regulator